MFPIPQSRRGDFEIPGGFYVECRVRPAISAYSFYINNALGQFMGIARITFAHFQRCHGFISEQWIDDFIVLRCEKFSHLTVIDGGRDAKSDF